MPERLTTDFGHTIHHVWDTPEFTKYPHSRTWYMIAAIFLVACIAYALFAENYLFAVILVLIAIVFVFHEIHEPTMTQFGITDQGVVWRGFLFPYKEVHSFWIVYDPPVSKDLYIDFKKTTTPRLIIPLEDEDPVVVRETLRQYIFEDLSKEDEPISVSLGRMLKI